MTLNDPDTLAQVTAAFQRYEHALVNNVVEVLDELFWDSAQTVRYGVNENLYGIDAIRAFRAKPEGDTASAGFCSRPSSAGTAPDSRARCGQSRGRCAGHRQHRNGYAT